MLYLFIYLITFLPSTSFQAKRISQATCVEEIYGSPSPYECIELLQSFADENDDAPRYFDEEQLRGSDLPGFPGVENIYPSQVFQMPAYWSLRSCNMALISYTEGDHFVAMSVSSWKRIRAAGEDLSNRCLFMGPSQGGSVVINDYYTGVPSIFLFAWETGSFFDLLLNEIQNDPTITPSLLGSINGTSLSRGNNSTLPSGGTNVTNQVTRQ